MFSAYYKQYKYKTNISKITTKIQNKKYKTRKKH